MRYDEFKQWKRYPKYKPSGVEWLGDIPEHWKLITVKHLAGNHISVAQTGPFGAQLHASDYVNEGIPLILIRNVNNLKIDDSDIPKISEEKANDLSMYRLELGDIVFSRVGSIGRIALVTEREEGWMISGQMLRLRIRNPLVLNEFAVYVLSSNLVAEYLNLTSVGSTRESINTNILRNVFLPIPPLPEQEKIAQFLDTETAKLDKLISKKQRLIELLQEKRTALISHAVTKGLNPDVPMKNSGVEWLGDIPQHWETIKIKRSCSLLRDGTHQPPPRVTNGIPLLSVRNIVNGRLVNLDDDSLISEKDFKELERSFKVLKNDILLAIVGATLGKVAIVEDMPPFTIQRSLSIMRPYSTLINYKFFYLFLSSSYFQKLLWANVGFSAQPGIYLGSLANFNITIPPLPEQEKIAAYLDRKTTQIDNLITKLRTSIDYLKEYRTALISAAVTGKIDIREEV